MLTDESQAAAELPAAAQPLYGAINDSTFVDGAGFSHLHKSLTASLLLHLLVVACVFMLRPAAGPLPASVRPEVAWQSVMVVTRNPQHRLPVTPPVSISGEDAGVADDASSVAGEPAENAAADAPERAIEPVAVTAVPALSGNPAPVIPRGGSTDNKAPVQLTPGEIQQAVSNFVGGYRKTLTTDWVAACLIEQKARGVQDCPDQLASTGDAESVALKAARELAEGAFASVTRPQRQASIVRELERDNQERLAPLMAMGGLLGEMATFRHQMNREYLAYLTGNFNSGTWGYVQASMAGHADVGGNGNMGYISNYMQPLCNPMPCVWNYTGFSVKPRPPTEEDATRFRVVPTVFGDRH